MQYTYSFPEEKYLLLGAVAKAQGLRGELSVYALSGQPETLGQYHRFTLVDKAGVLSPELQVRTFRVQKDRAIIHFEGVGDRTFAEKLVGMGLLLNRQDLPDPEDGEFYWHELYGLPVSTVQGEHIGTMQSVFSNGAQEVMVIVNGLREYLVPVSQGIIARHSKEEIVIDPPPGLLEINDEESNL
ncbi:ribosome maturation factor RimM [Desulfopila aestuarii]|uniref:Ribosome maturation factor RimM n=1 Tax=Desulfopila aestuarii DSM 18488 TaxID=1121416 RepID=A0A1M7YEP2_9BACT|nr:ribosome maturation factor RimM [Desulfopila aestuarii]SHO51049.1 16S rRNA processing protein RimM [Desulfopila aestuarii DSM 18488]